MSKAMIGPLIVGVLGVAVLLWLGFWQVQRLGWKQDVLAEIEAQIGAAPVVLPSMPTGQQYKFLPVSVEGTFTGAEIHVLASNKDTGAGYRIISVMKTQGRQVLVDRGFVPPAAKNAERAPKEITVTGNLHWPDEVDRYTPVPDEGANIWFARDLPAMARALGTDPVLIVASSATGDGISPFPVNTASIPNNHLNYAITWFLLAIVWFGMTVFLVLRIKRQSN